MVINRYDHDRFSVRQNKLGVLALVLSSRHPLHRTVHPAIEPFPKTYAGRELFDVRDRTTIESVSLAQPTD